MHTACVWSEKLPFAGYSVVKERQAFSDQLLAFSVKLCALADDWSRELRAELGGEYRARTGDLLVANQALSQLS
jgi:hypothetical protein